MEKKIPYIYTDEKGSSLYRKIRIQNGKEKSFYSERFENGKWISGTKGVRKVLYNLPSVMQGIRSAKKIYFVEGEKDVETLKKKGLVATTIAGRGQWKFATRPCRHLGKC